MSTRKILALLLAVVMACSLFVSPALAAEDEGIVAISDTVAPTFTDVDGHWAKDAIARWAEAGIIEGDGDGTVQPGRSLKRAELLTILARLLGLKETAPADTFTDVPADAWYAEAVLKCAKAGIVQGFGNGMAQPESPVDREQAIVMIGRALGVKPAAGHSLDRFDDKDAVSDWAAPYMVALTSMDILSGIPQGDGVIVAPQTNIDRASTFALLDKAIAQYVTAPCTVTVDDVNKFVVINSAAEEAGDVTVTGKTAGVVVAAGTTDAVVLNNATVGTVKVDAPVDVTISRGSNVTDLDANAAADVTNNGAVTNLNTNADDVTFDGNKPSNVNTAEDVKPATDSKGNEVTEAPASSGSNNGGSTGPRPTQKADVVGAPSVDQKAGGFGENVTDSATKAEGTVKTAATEETPGEYDVKITARGVKNHTNANNADAHWVGFGIPTVEGNTYWDGDQEIEGAKSRTIEVNNKTYNTIYFDDNDQKTTKVITVMNGDKLTATYNVTFDVTFWSVADADVKVLATEADTTAVIEKLQADGTPWAHKFAKGLGLNAAVSGNTVTLDGKTTLTALQNTYLGTEGCDGYLTYVLQVTDEAIKGIKLGNNAAELDELDLEGISLVMNKKIYDGTAKSFASAAATTFSLTDAAGRVQDEITVTVDASAVTIEGLKKATFMDGSKVVATLLDATSVTAPAVPASTDEVYYTGNWVSGETKVAAGAGYTFVGDAKEIIFTAETKSIGAQALKDRPVGPAGAIPSFDYAAAYAKAGVKLTGSNGEYTYTVDGKTFLEYAATQDNDLEKLAHTMEDGTTYYFYGVGIQAPANAVELVVAKTMAALDDEANSDTYTQDSEHFFDGEVLNYFGAVAEKKNDVYGFQDNSSFTRYTKWLDAQGNVLAVNKFVLKRVTNVPTFTVTYQDEKGNLIEKVEVPYGKADWTLRNSVPSALIPEGHHWDGKWYNGEEEYDTPAVLNADLVLVAKFPLTEYTFNSDWGGAAEGALVEGDAFTIEDQKQPQQGVIKTLPQAQNMRRTGFEFICWASEDGKYTFESGQSISGHPETIKTLMELANYSHEIKLVAQWKPIAEIIALDADTIGQVLTGGWATGLQAGNMVITLGEAVENEETGVITIPATGELTPYKYAGFGAGVDENQSFVVLAVKKPNFTDAYVGCTDWKVTDVVVRAGIDQDSVAYSLKHEHFTDKLPAGDETEGNEDDYAVIVMLVGNEEKTAKSIDIWVDWTGMKDDAVTGTHYVIDLSNVTFKAPATTPEQSGQGGEESTASLSAVETEEVIVLADAIVPSDDEVMEIPVLD